MDPNYAETLVSQTADVVFPRLVKKIFSMKLLNKISYPDSCYRVKWNAHELDILRKYLDIKKKYVSFENILLCLYIHIYSYEYREYIYVYIYINYESIFTALRKLP